MISLTIIPIRGTVCSSALRVGINDPLSLSQTGVYNLIQQICANSYFSTHTVR